jgi:hypothetical protein
MSAFDVSFTAVRWSVAANLLGARGRIAGAVFSNLWGPEGFVLVPPSIQSWISAFDVFSLACRWSVAAKFLGARGCIAAVARYVDASVQSWIRAIKKGIACSWRTGRTAILKSRFLVAVGFQVLLDSCPFRHLAVQGTLSVGTVLLASNHLVALAGFAGSAVALALHGAAHSVVTPQIRSTLAFVVFNSSIRGHVLARDWSSTCTAESGNASCNRSNDAGNKDFHVFVLR